MNETFIMIFSGIIAGSCPVLLAALGETISEKAGVINLSLDGCILLSALTGFVVSYHSASIALGFLAAAFISTCVSFVIGFLSLYLGVSQVAVGFVLTLLCRDLAYFFGNSYSRLQCIEIQSISIPFLSRIPFAGPVFFSHNALVYFTFCAVPLIWIFTERTSLGLKMKSVGENPYASYVRGIFPRRVRLFYTMLGGFFVGLSGASFSLFLKAGWGRPQGCEGTGWIALALVIFGGWSYVRVAAGCFLFSFLQIVGVFSQQWYSYIPAQVFQVAPFPLMIFSLVLVHFTQRWARDSLREKQGSTKIASRIFHLFSNAAPGHLGKFFRP